MVTLENIIYSNAFQSLEEIILKLQSDDTEVVQRLLDVAYRELNKNSKTDTSENFQTRLFLQGISQRLSGSEDLEQNLYLKNGSLQIDFFDLMAKQFPVVTFSQEIVNTQIIKLMKGKSDITILDIGIGGGQQIVSLIHLMNNSRCLPKKIHIIGIEPAKESLLKAEEKLKKINFDYDVDFTFTKYAQSIESFTESDWFGLVEAIQKNSILFINASFSLHHVHPSVRDVIFCHLADLQPKLITLIEPYSDHVTCDLAERFKNAWKHYGLTFLAIDRMEVSESDKQSLKEIFFGNEIIDVLASENKRIEQFETAEMWLHRLQNASLKPINFSDYTKQLEFNPIVCLKHFEYYSTIAVNGHPIISILGSEC